jgi:hypothetical protein
MAKQIKSIAVIGDVTTDVLKDGQDEVSATLGGAFFVSRLLKRAMSGLRSGPSPSVVSYSESVADELNPLQASWIIRGFAVKSRPRVFRCIERARPTIDIAPRKGLPPPGDPYLPPMQPFDLLIIEDLNIFGTSPHKTIIPPDKTHWNTLQQRPREWSDALRHISSTYDKGLTVPTVIAMINRHLPDFTSGLWKELLDKHARSTLVVLLADILRWDGLNISKQVSWERTAQDYLTQLYTDPRMRPLRHFRHVVVRFGVTGALHSYRIGKHPDRRWAHRLYFDPTAGQYGIYRDATIEGDLIGSNSMYVASIARELAEFLNADPVHAHNEYAIAETIGEGIRKGVLRCQAHFDQGYGSDHTAVRRFMSNGGFRDDLFAESATAQKEIGDERIPVGDLSWNILSQSAEYKLLDVAHSIVLKGVDRALNKPRLIQATKPGPPISKPPIWAPVIKFTGRDGRGIEVVDRREIESYRSVHNMLRAHLRNKSRRPLSIAVFGPPGSGKTHSVRVLAESAGLDTTKDVVREVNLSGQWNPRILKRTFKWAADAASKFGTPLVFFDEFDSRFENKELGWLKYFLENMEDWPSEGKPVGGPPVLVFGGSISYTYREFTRGAGAGKEQELRFARAKGPDFVSRLRGHIDIIGPNPTDEYDQVYVIRRALMLRRILEEKEPTRFQATDVEEWFQPELVRAMLKVSSYKHGVRSMRAAVDMCVPLCGAEGKYVAASLPTVPQLDMHVDGKEFARRVEEAKMELEREEKAIVESGPYHWKKATAMRPKQKGKSVMTTQAESNQVDAGGAGASEEPVEATATEATDEWVIL